jgi:polyhydroxybutyrate depolymerase
MRFHTLILALLSALLAGASSPAFAGYESLTVDGTVRSYRIDQPNQLPAPLVIILHPNTQTPDDMVRRTSWPAVAKREQFIAIYPEGQNRAWADFRNGSGRIGPDPPEGTDDVGFLTALIGKLTASGAADPHRIYVTGISNGGAMAMTMVCARAELFAAAASAVFNLNDAFAANCRPSRPVPLLLMNGTDDPLIPYEGGKGTHRFAGPEFWSTGRTFEFWKKINGCADDAPPARVPDRDPDDNSSVTRIEGRCPAGRDIVLYRIDGGGHRFPGWRDDSSEPTLVDALFGPQNHDIDGAETIWEFFRRFTKD